MPLRQAIPTARFDNQDFFIREVGTSSATVIDPVLELAPSLKIDPSEWLLTEHPFLNAFDLRKACFWEFARESSFLSSHFEHLFRFAQSQLPDLSMHEVGELLYEFAGECVATRFCNPPSSSMPFETASAEELSRKLLEIHKIVGYFDWRMLLSPLFPESAWSDAEGSSCTTGHSLSWRGPADFWEERFRKEVLKTVFEKRSYYVSHTEKAIEIRLNKPLASAVDLGAKAGLRLSEEIPIAVIAVISEDLSSRSAVEIAQEFVSQLSRDPEPNKNGRPPSDKSALVICGRSALDSSILRVDTDSFAPLRCLPVSRGQFTTHELLFLPLTGFTPERKLPLFHASVFEVEKRGARLWSAADALPLKEDCINALKSLGAARVRPHLNPSRMAKLWEHESARLGTVEVAGKKLKYLKERKVPSNRPIFSNWRNFEKAAGGAEAIFNKLFPGLDDRPKCLGLTQD